MARSGNVTLIYANTGTPAVPVWVAVAQQQGLEVTRGRNSRQVGHKDSSQDITVLGTKTKSYAFTGLFVPNQAALDTLRTAYESGTPIQVRMRDSGTDIEEMLAYITQFNESKPHDGDDTYSLTCEPADVVQELT